MQGKLKEVVRGIHMRNFGDERNETRLVDWLLGVADPAKVDVLAFDDLAFAAAVLAPLTGTSRFRVGSSQPRADNSPRKPAGLRQLRLGSSSLILEETADWDVVKSFPLVRHLSMTAFERVRFTDGCDPRKDEPYHDDTCHFVDTEWDDYFTPSAFPTLTSLQLIDGVSFVQDPVPLTPAITAVLGQLTRLDTFPVHYHLGVDNPQLWQSLTRLRVLQLRSHANARPGSGAAETLTLALGDLPGGLDVLDLSAWREDPTRGFANLAEALGDALEEGVPAVDELERVVLPDAGAWGSKWERERRKAVGLLAETIRVAGDGKIKVDYSDPNHL